MDILVTFPDGTTELRAANSLCVLDFESPPRAPHVAKHADIEGCDQATAAGVAFFLKQKIEGGEEGQSADARRAFVGGVPGVNLRALYQRLTGREAAALRHQRGAAEAALSRWRDMAVDHRQRADTAERERDAAVALLRALIAGEPMSWARVADFVAGRPLSAPTPLEVATHLLRALVRDRDEAALAEAAEWLRRESPR